MALAVEALSTFVAEVADSVPPYTIAKSPTPRAYMRVLADDEWSRGIKTEAFWNAPRRQDGDSNDRAASLPRSYDGNTDPERTENDAEARRTRRATGGYRTMCVRLCDGYYFPISFSTTVRHFRNDADACAKSCSSPARLYVYANPGGAIEDMRTPEGEPYANLKTAYLYRTAYDESCKCKPHAWQQEAQERHRVYALTEQARTGDLLAASELERIQRTSQAGSAEPATEKTANAGKSSKRLAAPQPQQPPASAILQNEPPAGQSAPQASAATGAGSGSSQPASAISRQRIGNDPSAMLLGRTDPPRQPATGNLDQWHPVFRRGL